MNNLYSNIWLELEFWKEHAEKLTLVEIISEISYMSLTNKEVDNIVYMYYDGIDCDIPDEDLEVLRWFFVLSNVEDSYVE